MGRFPFQETCPTRGFGLVAPTSFPPCGSGPEGSSTTNVTAAAPPPPPNLHHETLSQEGGGWGPRHLPGNTYYSTLQAAECLELRCQATSQTSSLVLRIPSNNSREKNKAY